MKKRHSTFSTAIAGALFITAVFVLLNLAYITSTEKSIEKISGEILDTNSKYLKLSSALDDEKEKMAFMSHVVDIKNILDSISANTGSYSSMDFAYLIARESFENELDPFLVLAVIKTESSFRKSVVSHKGAIGLMQILPNTAHYVSQMHEHIELTSSNELFEPETNILIGINYLSYLLDKFENQKYALIAYNMGPTNLIRKLRTGKNPSERYYRSVMRNYEQIVTLSGRA